MAPNDNFNGDQNNRDGQNCATQTGMQQESHDQQQQGQKNNCSASIKEVFRQFVVPIATPFRWVYRLSPIDKFTFILCLIGIFQVWSFIESERAYLVVDDMSFISSEPSNAPDGFTLHMIIRNVGKHTGTTTRIRITSAVFVTRKTLKEFPTYDHDFVGPAVPPIVANEQKHIFLFEAEYVNEFTGDIPPRDVILAGIMDGSVPMRVW